MKEVTAVIPVGKGRSEVWLDGECAFVLYRGELSRLDIKQGIELDEGVLKSIYDDILYPRAVNRLLYLLGSKDMTAKELEDKLSAGKYPVQVRKAALAKMAEYGYLDDASYARRYTECYIGRWSAKRIRQDLIKKGVDRDIISRAMEESCGGEQSAEQERELIKQLLSKRHYDAKTADRKEKQRHYAYLCRQGFSFDDISAVMFDLT